ncbi:MAG: (d)CMP kinase [Sedimentisphaerales bacterium]|nr:(d)CMP kinase [Sedimentisphaerales bacterium]
MAPFVVTIDGPAASGKSTVARLLAMRIQGQYLDTGAMYRTIAWAAIKAGVDLQDTQSLIALIDRTRFDFVPGPDRMEVYVDGQQVTDQIRDPELTNLVRFVADCRPVRDRLVQMQRQFAQGVARLVTEGRDQGTVAFPEAPAKFYLVADPRERARRRQHQLRQTGIECPLEEIEKAIRERDKIDQERQKGGLRPAPNAVIVDTTGLSAEQVVDLMASLLHQAFGITIASANRADDEGLAG